MEKILSNILKDPIEEIEWGELWNEAINSLPIMDKPQQWNRIANNFKNWQDKDDYAEKFLKIIKTKNTDTILDIGCGVGTISVPLAEKVSKVTGIDLSPAMLEILDERIKSKNITNFNYHNIDLKEFIFKKNINANNKFDIIIASRSLNTVFDIAEILEEINKIGKHVYITLWGPKSRNYLNKIRDIIGREKSNYPDFIYVYNILLNMGITANVLDLKCETENTYKSIEQSIHRHSRKIGKLTSEETELLREYLEDILIENEDGTFTTPFEDDDWIVLYWDNE